MEDFKPYPYSAADIQERVQKAISQELSAEMRKDAMRLIMSCIDLTTLEATDTESKVAFLCEQARSFSMRKPSVPDVAAVCVYPPFASLVKGLLEDTEIRTCCVAGAFPAGQAPLSVKLMEVSYVILEGADEVDMVMSRGRFLDGKFEEVADEIRAIKAACNDAHLKVILETGELKTLENIRKASEIALLSGADFLKTSTGKIQPAASPEAFIIMLDTIKEFYEATGERVGIKAAGGIAAAQSALQYYLLVKDVLGNDWLNKNLFRIGASRLAENIFNEL
ncbi:MAG TPA: deoxyribose-phosphate aldolase [Bacteroidales bacterium]|nr:deoxyribose-phosphate aldolase [Bacteroidales bacterium]